MLLDLCLNNARFLFLPDLSARLLCLISTYVCVAYYVSFKLSFPWFYLMSSGVTVISKGNKYKCYISYLESVQSWPDALSSFTLSLSSTSPAQDSDSGPGECWVQSVLNLFCGTSSLGKVCWVLGEGESIQSKKSARLGTGLFLSPKPKV